MIFTRTGQPLIVASALNCNFGEEAWGHPSNTLVQFDSPDGGRTFMARALTPPDGATARWLANLERPTGFNETPAQPGMIYTEGTAGAGLGDILRNKVWWRVLHE
ncbi:MAG: hypothetical protein IPN11_05855 [Opitutaceae bacterium]|nr:hypothetical protein [Opitutaceae bacterium]